MDQFMVGLVVGLLMAAFWWVKLLLSPHKALTEVEVVFMTLFAAMAIVAGGLSLLGL
jgi:nitrate reductase gamma subunit